MKAIQSYSISEEMPFFNKIEWSSEIQRQENQSSIHARQQKNLILNMSIQTAYKKLQGLFPELKSVTLVPITKKMVGKYHGFTFHNRIENAQYIEEGKLRYQKVAPSRIELNVNLDNALYVLLHQIAHCLSPLVWRKNKQEWERRQHDRLFYQKLWEIIKVANKEQIYVKQFDSLNHLMKYDASV